MKHNNELVNFCSYHARIGSIIVNATDQLLRMKESDGIVEIPSSVLPSKIPKAYKTRAKELNQDVKKLCDGSLFIDLKTRECKTHNPYIFYEETLVQGKPFETEILPLIQACYPDYDLIIIGSKLAAKKFAEFGVVEPVSLENGVIRGDKFRTHHYHF